MAELIELEDISKRYGDTTVVDRLSLAVRDGEVLILLGGSGSGKTTTLKMMNRLIEPSSGTLRIAGRDITALPAPALRRQIGYVFQRLGLFPHLTVAENIAITPSLLGWERSRIERSVQRLLERVELDPASLRDRYPHELSGGQAQRVAVARALAAEPQLVLLDEPFGALDPLTRERLQQSFLHIKKQLGFTAVFVTHDLVEALRLGDRIAVLRDGRLLQVGAPDELIAAPADPYVAELLQTAQRQRDELAQLLRGRAAKDDGGRQ